MIGRTFWPSAVSEMAGLPIEDTARAIAGLAAKDLVAGRPQSAIAGEMEYAFRQILTREVAYGMLPRSQRQRAHALAARWLEARLGERAEEAVEILAEHFRLAGDHTAAAAYLRRAASKARMLYANADAMRLFDQALHAAQRAGLTQEIPHLHLGRGDVHQLLGAYPAALADFEAGLAAAQQITDRALEAILENRIGLIRHRETRLEEAEAHFARAAALAREAGDDRTLGQSLVDLANIAWDSGDMEAADRILSEGVALLRGSGDPSGLARALNLRCMVHLAMGDGQGAIAAAEEALAAAREAGDKSREATSLSYLGVVHAWMGRPRTAIQYQMDSLSLAEAIGDRRRATYAREFLAQAYHDMGEWGEAIRLTLEFLLTAHQVTPLELPFNYMFLGQIYSEIGDMEHAREALRAASASAATARSLGWQKVAMLSAVQLARLEGDTEALNQALDRFMQAEVGAFVPSDGIALLPVGEALIETGRLDELRAMLAQVRPSIEKMDSSPYLASLAIVEARLAVHDGNMYAASALLDQAVRWVSGGNGAIMLRRALELRVLLFNQPEDREALERLHTRIAASLPEDLREVFLASQRVALVRRG